MPEATPPQGHGKWPNDPNQGPFHEKHMEHFELALIRALNDWPSVGATGVAVTFKADISKNPGGIKEYIVQIGG
jgi:hypothetical protein